MEKYLGNYRTTKKGSPHPSILPVDIPLSGYFSLMVDPLLQTTS